MIVSVPFRSSLSLHSLFVDCFINFKKFAHIQKYPFLLCKFFISKRRICNANLFQLSPPFQSDSIVQSLVFAISSCTSVSYCSAIHARVIKSLNYSDGFIGDRMVLMYFKLGYDEDAQRLFDEMPDRDLVSWNSLMSGLSGRGHLGACLNAFCRMRAESGRQPNEVTLLSVVSTCAAMRALDEGKSIHGVVVKLGMSGKAKVVNSLINMYGKLGFLDAASQLFEEMPVRSLVSWNSMVVIHNHNGYAEKGMDLFNLMKRAGINPDQATMVALLRACTDTGLGRQAESIHAYIHRCGFNADIIIATALLNLYAKLGRLNASEDIFEEMRYRDRIAWTAMLAGYAVHACGREAIKLFDLMVKEGVEVDHVTFTHLLSACSHSGLVEEGKKYFEIMSKFYRVEPRLDHYSCMVDLLGRSGRLEDAYELIKSMPMEPSSGVWGALLGACRVYGNVELGKEVAEQLLSLDPSDHRNYIMLSNIYSAAALMKERRLTRNPGCSFIEHGNKIHRFVVGDQSHPRSDEIHTKLEELIRKIREAGCAPKTEFVLHDIDEEVKVDMINKHSEKLAIAFGLLVTGSGVPLIITKNLRICGDCHSTAKFASLLEKRTIIIRDSKRFHHFAEGLCSCRDYW
ncbi:hypothetical protein PVL29_023157 [Vitis rotundifolia]|uniref:DYW domain-containing protein n=1 Tax=Vitis rotundifolia TaxID=103349 RepID=A0AA38YMX7_VITRO|nr:hypothetical protein PVL29_023157 [Vitis rotundifolia]